jgi:hypothetical protein
LFFRVNGKCLISRTPGTIPNTDTAVNIFNNSISYYTQ